MGNFRQGKSKGRFSRGSNSGDRGFGRDRDFRESERRRPLEMHEVTCDKCGKQCKVPFRPTGDKPVYCSDCFEKTGNFRSRNRDSGQNRSSISSEKLDQINLKLDKIMKSLNLE
ncbi:hypothetical protein HY498_02380 [Candidatus Woesearchaeota archaeon]|nr:hypothetical protein [Candidatus Woesearchaeota archaeon]